MRTCPHAGSVSMPASVVVDAFADILSLSLASLEHLLENRDHEFGTAFDFFDVKNRDQFPALATKVAKLVFEFSFIKLSSSKGIVFRRELDRSISPHCGIPFGFQLSFTGWKSKRGMWPSDQKWIQKSTVQGRRAGEDSVLCAWLLFADRPGCDHRWNVMVGQFGVVFPHRAEDIQHSGWAVDRDGSVRDVGWDQE